jgi:thiosulfate dehydrogenase [quinone] large subunit
MKCNCCDGRAAAAAVGRWSLGVLFFFAGLGKLMGGVGGFVNGYLVPAFEKTFLPVVLLKAYGYALPFVEVALGVLLIIGLCRNCTLLLTGLTLISLAFGQMLLQQHATVANIFLYIVLTVVVLFLDEHDSWRPGHKPSSSDKSGCGCSCG